VSGAAERFGFVLFPVGMVAGAVRFGHRSAGRVGDTVGARVVGALDRVFVDRRASAAFDLWLLRPSHVSRVPAACRDEPDA
jgi:hypothetical protein